MTDQTTEERLRRAIRAALPRAVNFRIPVALPTASPVWDLIAGDLARAITLPDGEVITDAHGDELEHGGPGDFPGQFPPYTVLERLDKGSDGDPPRRTETPRERAAREKRDAP